MKKGGMGYMKTASKVFLILSIVCGAILMICGAYFAFGSFEGTPEDLADITSSGISLIVTGILMLVVAILALVKLKKAKTHKELVGIGICAIFFCSLLAGAFILSIKDEDLNPTKPSEPATTEQQ